MAPTKEVYAVVERPPSKDSGAAPERQLRVLRWGLIPSWAKEPGDRQPDDQRPDGDGRGEAGLPPRVRRRDAACCRPTATSSGTRRRRRPRPASRASSRSSSGPRTAATLAMAGLYEIWKDPTRDDDDPERFRWTCTVLTTEAEDSVGHIHDRMPLMVEPDRWASWLDPTVSGKDDLLVAARPGGPGRARGLPVSRPSSATSATTGPSWSSRSRSRRPSSDPLTNGRPAMTARNGSSPPRTATAGWSRTARGRPIATLLLSHGAGGGIGARDLVALAHDLPRQGITVVLFEQPWRVAGRKVATPPATLDVGLTAAAAALRTQAPLVRRRALGRRAVRRALRDGARCDRLPGAGVPAAPARQAGEDPGPRAAVGAEVPDAGDPGRARHDGPARGLPGRARPGRRTRGRPRASRCRRGGPVTQAEAMEIVVEATLEWIVREVTGNQRPA